MDTEADEAAFLRQEGESDRAFAAFRCYRNLPPASRSLNRAYTAFLRQNNAQTDHIDEKRAPRHWQNWACEWSWSERCEKFDRHTDRENIRTAAEARRAELVDFHDRLTVQARTFAQFVHGLQRLLLNSLQDRLRAPESLTTAEIARILRQVAYVQQVANNAEAAAFGVPELLRLLDEED